MEAESIIQDSGFHPFSSHGPHKLNTQILQHTKKFTVFFADLTKK